MVEHRTGEARSRLSYFFWGSVGMAFGSGVVLALAARGTGGAATFAVILAYFLLAAASILMSISIIGWGVWLGLNAAGFWPRDETTPVRAVQPTATDRMTPSPSSLGATEPRRPRDLNDITPLDPSV